MVFVGWLGRGNTTLHCTHHARCTCSSIEHLLCSFAFLFVYLHGICVVTTSVRQVWCSREREGRCELCGFRKLQSELTAVCAESLDARREHSDSITGTLRLNVTPGQPCLPRWSLLPIVMHLCITQVRLSVLSASITWFWPLALPTERPVHGKTPMRSLC